MLSIPNLAPIFLKIPRPEFQIPGNSGSRKPIGGIVSGTTRPGIRLRAPNYEAFLKISTNLRSHDHFKVMIYLKNLWKQVAIKWRGYWSKFSLCKCCSSSTLPRQKWRYYLRHLCHSFVVNTGLESPAYNKFAQLANLSKSVFSSSVRCATKH